MRKEDMSTAAILLEAITIIAGLVYIGLQVYYGIFFHIPAYKLVMNILMMLLVYAGLSMLSVYPERINRLDALACKGRVRAYSLRMIRLVKFIFVVGLLIPCVFDAMGMEIQSACSLLIIGLIIIVAVYYEYRIISELKKR